MSVEHRGAQEHRMPPGETARILVVDDNPDVREITEIALRRAGYAVRCAADGQSGLEALEDFQPDLVLVDIMMPGMNGLEMCRRMRELPAHRDRSVIVLSARTDTKDRIAGLELGADDYLVKPVTTEELVARVRRKLARSAAHREEIRRQRQEAIGQLAVAVCHEINNPLFALLGEIQLGLADESLPPEVHERLRCMEELALRMSRVLGKVSKARDVATPYVGETRMTDLWAC